MEVGVIDWAHIYQTQEALKAALEAADIWRERALNAEGEVRILLDAQSELLSAIDA
jgi:hypothetical protein